MLNLLFIFFLFIKVTGAFQITADSLFYDEEHEILIAHGHVRVIYKLPQKKQRILYAKDLIYRKKNDSLKSSGKVTIIDEFGSVASCRIEELRKELTIGIIKDLKIFTHDRARFVATKGKYSKERLSTLYEAAYTPCKTCKKDPFWEIKAKKIIHDKQSQTISYKNARLEIKKIPVLYTPYFWHPDPTVKRKSGFLAPSFGLSKDFGTSLSQPFFYTMAPSHDITLIPTFLSKDNPILAGEYRNRFHNGDSAFSASYTYPKHKPQKGITHWQNAKSPQRHRWHVFGKVDYHIADNKRIKVDLQTASDTTYLSRYSPLQKGLSFFQSRNLTSSAFFEKFQGTSYLKATGYTYQTDTPDTTPTFIPHLIHQKLFRLESGGLITIDSNLVSISRRKYAPHQCGKKKKQAATTASFQKPWILGNGQRITSHLSIRGDLYKTDYYFPNQESTNQGIAPSQTIVRVLPKASLEWDYPLFRSFQKTLWAFSPRLLAITSPKKLQTRPIPNEDPKIFNLDETNLFSSNYFSGFDCFDRGERAIMGADNKIYFQNGKHFYTFIGQSYRLDRQKNIPTYQGEGKGFSDTLLHLEFQSSSWWAARYRTALKPKNSYKTRYSELGISLGQNRLLNLDASVLSLNKELTHDKKEASQLHWALKTNNKTNWNFFVAQIRNLKKSRNDALLGNFSGITYQNECCYISLSFYQTAYSERDIKPNKGFLFRITFKNLGGYSPGPQENYPKSILTNFSPF